jgi:hypothetical protein
VQHRGPTTGTQAGHVIIGFDTLMLSFGETDERGNGVMGRENDIPHDLTYTQPLVPIPHPVRSLIRVARPLLSR